MKQQTAPGSLMKQFAMRRCQGAFWWTPALLGILVAPAAASTYSDLVISHGPAAYWRLGEATGSSAISETGTNHGTYENNVSKPVLGAITDDSNTAANFGGGANDRVQVPAFGLSGSGITILVWFKADKFGDARFLSKATSTDPDDHYWMFGTASSSQFRVRLKDTSGSNNNWNPSVSTMTKGAWYFAAMTYDGATIRVYLNGAEVNSTPWAGSLNTDASIAIGLGNQPSGAGDRGFNGVLDEVAVFDKALSAEQVDELYKAAGGGLVGHWKLAETSGTTAVDSSVYGYNGTVSGAANWSTRCDGSGVFDFDGSSNYVSVPNGTHLRPTFALTLAGWIKGDLWGSGDDVDIVLRKGDSTPNSYQLAIADGKVALFLNESDSGGFRGNTVLKTGRWYHVAATWDGADVRIYLDGQLDNTPAARTGTLSNDNRPLYLGGRSSSDFFDGMLYDARLYNRALSHAEIAQVFGFTGHWKFAEGSGTAAADSSGVANNAALSGGATWTADCSGNNALQTNGAGGVAQTASAFAPPDVGTVVFWMQSNGNPPALGRIFGLGGDWEARQMPDGTVAFDLCGEGNGNFVTTVPLNEVGRWYHVAATFDATTDAYAIYIDGQLDKSGTNSNGMTQQAAAILSFGTRTGSTQYWYGALRDFRVYTRRLCPTEIAELYGLVGYWKLDETSGSTAADSTAFGRNGSVIGTASWSTAAVDNGLELNGATRVEVTSLMDSPKNVTLAAWARLSQADSGGAEIVSLGDYFAIRLDNGTVSRAFFYTGSSWTSVSINQTFARTGWHHFAAVFNDDQDTCKLYLDGAEVASISTTVTIPYNGLGTKTVIGAHGNGGSTYDFTGKVDDVRVYNRALCPAEIQSVHNGIDPFEGVRIIKWVEVQ